MAANDQPKANSPGAFYEEHPDALEALAARARHYIDEHERDEATKPTPQPIGDEELEALIAQESASPKPEAIIEKVSDVITPVAEVDEAGLALEAARLAGISSSMWTSAIAMVGADKVSGGFTDALRKAGVGRKQIDRFLASQQKLREAAKSGFVTPEPTVSRAEQSVEPKAEDNEGPPEGLTPRQQMEWLGQRIDQRKIDRKAAADAKRTTPEQMLELIRSTNIKKS